LIISGKLSKLKIDDMRNTFFNNETLELPFKPQISKKIDYSFTNSKTMNNFKPTVIIT